MMTFDRILSAVGAGLGFGGMVIVRETYNYGWWPSTMQSPGLYGACFFCIGIGHLIISLNFNRSNTITRPKGDG